MDGIDLLNNDLPTPADERTMFDDLQDSQTTPNFIDESPAKYLKDLNVVFEA